MTDFTIYHNPACGTSRNVLAMMRQAGIEPKIVEYLKDTPSREALADVIARAGLKPRDVLRRKEALFGELALDDEGLSDEALIDAMVKHPILIERPLVVTPLGARLCRPSEKVRDLLPGPQQPFTKEDGERVG